MDEYVIKQKIQEAYPEPRAPKELIPKVISRTQAVTMGVKAQQQLKTAPVEKIGELASRALIGQLASVSELPKGVRPEQLAQQLEQEQAFAAALRGGNVLQRLGNGELMQQIVGQMTAAEQEKLPISTPKKEGPIKG